MQAKVEVERDDTDTRAVMALLVSAWGASAWVGLLNLRRVVGAARSGRPFDARNVGRIRWCAGVLLAQPVIWAIVVRVLDHTLEADPPVQVTSSGPGWSYAVVGLGLLALAEVFARGSELRELDETTI